MSLRTSTTARAVIAIVATTMSLAAFTPAANAAGPDRGDRDGRKFQTHRQAGPMGDRGQFLALGCGPDAAQRIEIGLVRLGYRVDATDEQKTLLDTLKTSTLAAQADLAAVCADVMPAPAAASTETPAAAAPAAAERPDLLTRLQSGLRIQEARLAAMTAVLPQFEAFYASLTDEQKAALEPRRSPRGDRGRSHDGRQHHHRSH
mgnify:CR=1 FL=1